MPRVFLVQEPIRRSASTGGPIPLFDLTPAKEFGDITTCLDWSDTKRGFDAEHVMDKLADALRDFGEDDFLLPAGNTVAIAMASMLASEFTEGRVKFLLWEKIPSPGQYRIVDISVYNS